MREDEILNRRIYNREYYLKTKDRRYESTLKWRRKNPQAVRKYRINYRPRRDKTKIAAQNKKYREAHKAEAAAISRNYSAKKKAAKGNHTADDIKKLYDLQRGVCTVCKISLSDGYHVDHIVPICRGGDNDKYNLQLLCRSCNCSKSGQDPIEFMQKRGKLL